MGFFWKTTAEQRSDILDRYRAGEPVKWIALNCKISRSYVTVLARKAGLPLRNWRYKRKHSQ